MQLSESSVPFTHIDMAGRMVEPGTGDTQVHYLSLSPPLSLSLFLSRYLGLFIFVLLVSISPYHPGGKLPAFHKTSEFEFILTVFFFRNCRFVVC